MRLRWFVQFIICANYELHVDNILVDLTISFLFQLLTFILIIFSKVWAPSTRIRYSSLKFHFDILEIHSKHRHLFTLLWINCWRYDTIEATRTKCGWLIWCGFVLFSFRFHSSFSAMKRENFIDLQVSISKSIVCANNMIESSVIIVTFIK